MIVRTAGDPHTVANAVRQQLKAIYPAMPAFGATSVEEQLDTVVSQEHLLTIPSVTFALMATLLACLGLYGMMAYATARRTREFGIRIALGATAGGVRAMVLRGSFLMALAGIAAGIPLSIAGARAASAILFGIGATDWRVFTIAASGVHPRPSRLADSSVRRAPPRLTELPVCNAALARGVAFRHSDMTPYV